MTHTRSMFRFMLGVAAFMLTLSIASVTNAAGWESLTYDQLIQRSSFIGTGRLILRGQAKDGWREGRIVVRETFFSGIGDVDAIDVKVAVRTEEGVTQNWPDQKSGIWFVLNPGDPYAQINHPACWVDESKAKSTANTIYAYSKKAYQKAKREVAKAKYGSGDNSSGNSSGDTTDTAASIAGYAQMAAAAAMGRGVPHQDANEQKESYYEQATDMLKSAGVGSPFPEDLKSPAGQESFFNQVKQMLGPAGAAMGNLPGAGAGDPGRANQLLQAKDSIAGVLVELIRSTLGAKNPTEALAQMKPIKLPFEDAQAGPQAGPKPGPPTPPGPPGAGPKPPGPAGGAPSFKLPSNLVQGLPKNASRGQMLNSAIGRMGKGGIASGPRPPGPPGPPGPPRGP